MIRRWSLDFLGLYAVAAMLALAPAVHAQEAGDGPPESSVVEPEQEGRRLGNLSNDQIRQFQMRRAFEEDLPECLPQIRAMMDEEQRNRNWMAFGIDSVLLLVFS